MIPAFCALTPSVVRRQLAEFRECVLDVQAGLSAFGPRQLAKRLLRAIECLEHAHAVLQSEGKDREGVFARVVAELYNKYLEYVLSPIPASFPVELLLPLRQELCRLADYPPEAIEFSLHEKPVFNNEFSAGQDPLRSVVQRLDDAFGDKVIPAEFAEESQRGPVSVLAISYPAGEGRKAILHPLLLHEVAHAVDYLKGLSDQMLGELWQAVAEKLRKQQFANEVVRGEVTDKCREIVKRWAMEISTDLIVTYHFGPSLLCALRLAAGILQQFDQASETHPDGRLRATLMLELMVGYCFQRDDAESLETIPGFKGLLASWLAELLKELQEATEPVQPANQWVALVRSAISQEQQRSFVVGVVRSHFPVPQYAFGDKFGGLVDRLREGIPPDQAEGERAALSDIFNAGWAVCLMHEDRPFRSLLPQTDRQIDLCHESVNELVLKAIESSYLLGRAADKGRHPLLVPSETAVPEFAILGAHSREGAEVLREGHVTITPILDRDQIRGAAIDLRLGSHFLVPKAADLLGFDASQITREEMRRIQDRMTKSIGQDLVLHPGRMILGQTLEYLCLPQNIAGMVLSRSRYGRLGLVVATATFVHPGWHGSLTLELAHYGDVPIRLKCGTPVAQLVLSSCTKVPPTTACRANRPPFPTRPELTEMIADADQRFLDALGGELEHA